MVDDVQNGLPQPPAAETEDARLCVAALQAVEETLATGRRPQSLPETLAHHAVLDQVLSSLVAIHESVVALAQGDLDHALRVKGAVAGAINSLQAALRHLTWKTKQIACGDFNQQVEFMGEFSDAFNAMVRALAEAQADLRWREIGLTALNELQQRLLGPGALPEKLAKITDAAVRLFDVDFCRIWVIKPGDRCASGCVHAELSEGPHVCEHRDRCLHLLSSSGRYTHLDGKVHRRVPFGCYKIGRVASGEDHKFLTNEAATDPRVHNHEWAQELGLVAFAGYQLRPPGGETIGVLALFSKHVITPETDAMLEGLANTATQVIQSAAAEEEQQNLQSQLVHAQRLESVGQLAGGIAHEINTPAQFVRDNTRFLQTVFPKLQDILDRYAALATLCRAGPVPAHVLDELEAATRAAKLTSVLAQIPEALVDSLEGLEHVTKIVRAMKDFASCDAQEVHVADVNRAIENTVTVARNEWSDVAEMILDLDPALPPAPCLLAEINHVLLNIVVNAAHAIKDAVGDAGPGKGTITITTRCTGGQAEIRIADTGTGIPAEHRDRIFEQFFTTKKLGQGAGQGLAVARRVIVEKHRGTLTFETEVGRGTTFIIRLPVESAAQVTPERAEHERANSVGR